MRKLKEVLRLQSLGLSQHQIARSCSLSQSTVHEYVSAAQAAGVKWPMPEDWGDQQSSSGIPIRVPVNATGNSNAAAAANRRRSMATCSHIALGCEIASPQKSPHSGL